MTDPTTNPSNRPLTAADILAPVLPEPFALPELGGVVCMYQLSAADAFDFANAKGDGWETAIMKLISKVVVDAEGRPLFAGIPHEELKRRLPIHAFNRLQKEINRQMDAGYGPAGTTTTADTGGEPVTNPFGPSSSGESRPEAPTEPDNPTEPSNDPTQTPPAPAS